VTSHPVGTENATLIIAPNVHPNPPSDVMARRIGELAAAMMRELAEPIPLRL
jgi:hypothetical protein